MINCNPETVSADYDTSDRLYLEPLTFEDVYSIYQHETREGRVRRSDCTNSADRPAGAWRSR